MGSQNSPQPQTKSRLAICVPTFRRPVSLQKLLRALNTMTVPDDVEVQVVIVDNDGDNKDIAPDTSSLSRWPVNYVVESERGIPFSRNRAVVEAGDVDAIVWFDDDEQPRTDCLERLVAVWRDTGADVVQGGSNPVFESPPPAWIERGGYFARKFEADGLKIGAHMARTSNVLITRSLFDIADPPFDLRLRLIGSEDTFLSAVQTNKVVPSWRRRLPSSMRTCRTAGSTPSG